MATAYRFAEADDSSKPGTTTQVGILQRSLSAPVPPQGEEDDTFFAAVMAAGGNVTRSVSVSGNSGPAQQQPTSSASSASSTTTSITIPSEVDTSLNEDLFFPSVSAAAAVTLSPSFGPSSTSDFYGGGYGQGTWSMQQQQQQQQQHHHQRTKGEEMPSLGLPMSASSSHESNEDYQLRQAMAGMQMSRGGYDPNMQQMYYPQDQYGYQQQQYMQHQQQQHQQNPYGRYPQQQDMYQQRGMATASLAPVMDQQRYSSYGGGGYGNNNNNGGYGSSSEYPQQQRMGGGYGGGGRGGGGGGYGGGKQQQQQQSGGAGGGRRASPSQWSSQQQQQQQPAYDDYSQPPTGRPRSSILEDLRAAMRASSATARHRVVMTSANQVNGFARPPPNGMFLAPQQQHGGGGNNNNMANTQLMQAAASSIPYTLNDVRGHAVELAQDQFGSRWLQQQLSSSSVNTQDKQALFMELLPAAKDLASDTFGNYCVQILLNPSVGTAEQQRLLCQNAFEGNMLELSRNTYACRCIQSLVKLFQLGDSVIPIVRQDKMLRELERDILVLVTDSNANHVAQQIIERVRPVERIGFVLTAFQGNYVSLAKDPYGCRVCQRVLEHASTEYVEPALEELLAEIDDLVTDSMGNYVVQHIITASGDRYGPQRVRLVEAVKEKLLMFATHKFASNVVEKVLEYGDAKTRREIIGLMLDGQTHMAGANPAGPTVPLLQVMMSDLFANYVCQRSLAVADRDQLIRLVAIVRGSAHELRRMTYGKHILSACEKAAAAAGIP